VRPQLATRWLLAKCDLCRIEGIQLLVRDPCSFRSSSRLRQRKRRVRFATAAALINGMVEAKHQLQLGRALARWARYDLIALDEVGDIPLAEGGAEFLFRVSDVAEGAAERSDEPAAAWGASASDSTNVRSTETRPSDQAKRQHSEAHRPRPVTV
jgi:IstB-like ATP binding protein